MARRRDRDRCGLSRFCGRPHSARPNALWNIINLKCLRHLAKAEAPIPCDNVDVSGGWDRGLALLKDRIGLGRMLAIPTSFVSGLEDPAVLSPDKPNYFAAAWSKRDSINWRLQRTAPAESVAVTVNSKPRRDQDVLSFAIDCLDKGVANSLAANAASIDNQWSRMSVTLKGRTYWARRVDAQNLSPSPFQLLADGVEGAKADMGSWSLAVTQVKVSGDSRVILLADRAEGAVGGRASDLQDPSCAIATR